MMSKDIIKVDEIKDITIKTGDLIDKSNKFMQIFTRAADPGATDLVEFKIFDNVKLAKLAENMPEINRATNVFGRQNSQATGKLMSLNMISQSPYRRLKQCLAQIERKRQALKENIFKLRKEKVEMDKMIYTRDTLQDKIIDETIHTKIVDLQFELQLLTIDIEEKVANMGDTSIYIEGALKEIGMYQEAYYEIKDSYNIPDNWDEGDFERCEVEEHVKTAFLHTIRDLEMTGRLNVGTHEYLEQYGVNPHTAVKLVQQYLNQVDNLGKDGAYTNINVLYDFLDRMHEIFKEEYKHAMKRIGLQKLISEDYLYLEDKSDSLSKETIENIK